MGKGVALEFKEALPAMFEDYVSRCEQKTVRLGQPYLYRDASGISILNFPTKDHWRSPARLQDIERGLDYFAQKQLSGISRASRCRRWVAVTVGWSGRRLDL